MRNMIYPARRALVRLILVVALSILTFSSQAWAADRDRLQAFLQVTGFDVALDSIALSASDAPVMLGIDAGAFGSEWTRLSDEVFDLDVMRGIALDILEETLSDQALAHAAEFYASDLGQRLVEVENAAHMVEDDTEKREGGETLIAEMMREGSPRLTYFQRMQGAIDSEGVAVQAIQMVQMRFLLAASAAGVIELRMDADELAAALAAQEGELRRAIRQNGLAQAAWVYRDFDDAEILTYTEALEQPLMQEVYELLNAVQYEITANRFEALAVEMADLTPGQDI